MTYIILTLLNIIITAIHSKQKHKISDNKEFQVDVANYLNLATIPRSLKYLKLKRSKKIAQFFFLRFVMSLLKTSMKE